MGKNFLTWRIRPVARKLGIPDRLVTFQVMRRTLGTDMQQHGTLKDTQGMLRHASIKTTGDVYVQTIEQSVLAAVNSRTSAVLGDRKMPEKNLGLKGEGRRMTWLLLFFRDEFKREVRFELSRPTKINKDEKVDGWIERILFRPFPFDGDIVEIPRIESPNDGAINIEIKRKA